MGGHGHGPPYEIPNPDIYKVEDVPQLVRLQKRLAEKGLHDPWARNVVWRYAPLKGSSWSRVRQYLFKGFGLGFGAFLLTIGAEYALGIDHHAYKHQHGGHNGHGEHSH